MYTVTLGFFFLTYSVKKKLFPIPCFPESHKTFSEFWQSVKKLSTESRSDLRSTNSKLNISLFNIVATPYA